MEHFFKVSAKHFDCQPGSHGFFNQLDVIKTSSKPHCSLSPGRIFEGPQFPKLRLLRCPNFLEEFFCPSFRWVLPAAWPGGCGSRGHTPLHFAARDSVVQRLLEAKAAVDAKNEDGRGLGGGYRWGNLMKHGIPLWSAWRCWWFKFLVDIVFTIFWKACQNICTNVWCCSPSLWVGVSLNQGF